MLSRFRGVFRVLLGLLGTNLLAQSVEIPLRTIEGGTFVMGGKPSEAERPAHRVTLSGFSISISEVTQTQWARVMAPPTGALRGESRPEIGVSWYSGLVFCNKLSGLNGKTPCYRIKGTTDPDQWGKIPVYSNNKDWDAVECDFSADGYRLPTEAEWEYAAKGGTKSAGFVYSGANDIQGVGWFSGNSRDGTNSVGRLLGNEVAVFDMSGNVREWCWDWFGPYTSADQTDPQGPASGDYRLGRGGSWQSPASELRTTSRAFQTPFNATLDTGLRLVTRP